MAFWRYFRDVLIVLGVLLMLSGLAVGWGLFCITAWCVSWLASVLVDSKFAGNWKKIRRKRP